MPAQKLNLLKANNLLVRHKKIGTGTICKNKLVYHKTFETVQNVLEPVEGRGIGSTYFSEKLISLIFITNKVALKKKEYKKKVLM